MNALDWSQNSDILLSIMAKVIFITVFASAVAAGLLGGIFGPGYFFCGIVQGCDGPRSFFAYTLAPLLGYDLGNAVAHIIDVTPFTGTVFICATIAWLAKGRDDAEELNEALAALKRCDGCKATFPTSDYLTKVEGKGFLCDKCRAGAA
jgi:hypothetical protein